MARPRGISTIHSSSLGDSLLVISAGSFLFFFLPRLPRVSFTLWTAASYTVTARPLNFFFFAELNFQSSTEKDSIDSVDFPAVCAIFRRLISLNSPVPFVRRKKESRGAFLG